MAPGYKLRIPVATFFILASAAAMVLTTCSEPPPPAEDLSLTQFRHDWEYRWGDSPLDEAGIPEWTYAVEDPAAWQLTDLPYNPPGRRDHNYLWLRCRLPDFQQDFPVLYLTSTILTFDVYIDTVHIYNSGKMGPHAHNRYAPASWKMIPLPDDAGGRQIFFRIFSDDPNVIGIPLQGDNEALIGTQSALIHHIVRKSIDRFVLGCLFILIGIMSVDLFFHRWRQKNYYYLSFGAFAICTGLMYMMIAEVMQFLIKTTAIRFHLATLGLLLFPVGFFAFYEQVIELKNKLIIRRMWQFLLVYAIIALLIYNVILYAVWSGLLIVCFAIGIYYGIRAAARGDTNARIFNFGFIVTILFVLHDLLFIYGIIPYWRWMSHWGVLIFILALTHIIERKNDEDTAKLARYSQELKKYSDTLEDKVEQRTRELSDKNTTLEETLKELRATQEHLLLKEKMASLGQLVAGITHEINNPVGAIRGAADVSRRCVQKIEHRLNNGDRPADAGQDADLNTVLKMLGDNQAVVTGAAGRIADIIKSLKQFAQLDESEYRRYNIHDGLDSTLVLLENVCEDRIEIRRQYDDIPEINCYAGQLNQVFFNLLKNAVEAIDGTGRITLSTRRDGDKVWIRISDTGRGISETQRPHLFEFNLSTRGARVKMGTGLSTAFTIIQQHGGEIRVESESGNGSTFIVILPFIPAEPEIGGT